LPCSDNWERHDHHRYLQAREIIEAVPDALVAHVQLSRLLSDFGAAGRAG